MNELVKRAILQEGLEHIYASLRNIPRTYAERNDPDFYYLAEDERLEPWRHAICDRWTLRAKPLAGFLLSLLGENGPDHVVSDTVNEVPGGFIQNTPAYHEYLVDSLDNKNPLIIDGTWQQFANPELLSQVPKLMVMPASQTHTVLQAAGVDPGLWHIWRPDRFDSIQRVH